MALGESVKQFTNCRFGMMGWACVILGFAAAQYDEFGHVSNAMAVNVTLQLIYIAKFFHWESGYFATMDMQEDRAGFYICWGCLCWVTALYTSSTLSLVAEPADIPNHWATAIFVSGVACILFNYSADAQRKLVRETNAKCLIWGRTPEIIHAKYTTSDGVEHESLLLVSGFWGISRHSHYLFELGAAFLWSVPGTIKWFGQPGLAPLVPLAYFIFLTILLFDRSVRDDKRCSKKYGVYWDDYRKAVPYKIIPGVF
jgi:7-dehydrocholesterol reductase